MHYTNTDGNILLTKSSKILSNTEVIYSHLEVTSFYTPATWKQDQHSHCSPNQVHAQERAQLWKATARPPTGSSVLKHILLMHKFSVYVPTVPTTICREAFLLLTERILRYLKLGRNEPYKTKGKKQILKKNSRMAC